MIYKKENGIGFKTVKRRIEIELQGLIVAIPVVFTGGDLKKQISYRLRNKQIKENVFVMAKFFFRTRLGIAHLKQLYTVFFSD